MKQDNSALNSRMKQLDDPWFTPGDTHLDTSGLNPQYRPVTIEQNDFDVPLAGSEKYRDSWARDAVLNPEILSTLAETQNLTEDEQAVLKHYGNKNPSITFYVNGFKVHAKWDKNTWNCSAIEEETGTQQRFKLGGHSNDDRDAVMGHCARYLVPAKPWRELTSGELDVISRMASAGVLSELIKAAEQYCFWALDRYSDDPDFNPIDERFEPLYSESAWYVFIQSHVDLDDSAVEWMRSKLGDRAPTINALFAVYELWQREQQRMNRGLLFNPPEPEPETPESVQESLESLSDSALADLRTRTIKLAAHR